MPTKQKTNIAILTNLYRTLNYKFKKKQNIQQFLKKNKFTHDQIIKISYDIQSGTYINFYTKICTAGARGRKEKRHKKFENVRRPKNRFVFCASGLLTWRPLGDSAVA